jgi:hypothetical protein
MSGVPVVGRRIIASMSFRASSSRKSPEATLASVECRRGFAPLVGFDQLLRLTRRQLLDIAPPDLHAGDRHELGVFIPIAWRPCR